MRLRLGLALVLLCPAPAAATQTTSSSGTGDPLADHSPVVVHARGDRSPLTSVRAFAGRVPGVRRGRVRPTIYGRRVGPWLQYWLFFAGNGQDRGVLRTGRHEGDWELLQYRLRGGRVVQGVYSQHAGAERCGRGPLRFAGRRPVAYLAHGSHAAYFVPGLRDRMWPDPNDEADGRGRRMRPRLVRISTDDPPWMRHRGSWGGSRAGWVPGEMDSPRGPAFQPHGRWSDAAGWAAAARPCRGRRCDARGECDGGETAVAAGLAGGSLLAALLAARRRVRRRAPASS